MQIEKTIGEGPQSVYVYYNPNERRLALLEGRSIWECKVGSTRSPDVTIRIFEQVPLTAMAREPVVGLVILCEDAYALESKIHKIFKNSRIQGSGGGQEWFLTSPQEVETFWLDNVNPTTAKFGLNERTVSSLKDLGGILENQRKYLRLRQRDMEAFCPLGTYKLAAREGLVGSKTLQSILEGLGLEMVIRSKTLLDLANPSRPVQRVYQKTK